MALPGGVQYSHRAGTGMLAGVENFSGVPLNIQASEPS